MVLSAEEIAHKAKGDGLSYFALLLAFARLLPSSFD